MNEPDEPPIHRLDQKNRFNSYVDYLRPRTNPSPHDTPILPITNRPQSLQNQDQDALYTVTDPVGSGAPASRQQTQHVTYDASATAHPMDTNYGEKATPLDSEVSKPGLFKKTWTTVNLIIFSSWVNCFLIFVPVGIALGVVQRSMGDHGPISPTVVFSINAVAIIPLAWMLGYATECVAADMGDTVGALLNVTFGNAVELIIFIIALVADEIAIVQASLLGSILANLLLILGMCFLFGGLRFREQLYNSAVTQMSACLLSLSVISLLLPTAFHASFSTIANADAAVLKVSRGTSVVLLLVYILYLLFQLKSHSYIYESTPQHVIDEESHPGVLADILNSSSSSESSSDDDSDSSSGSHTTVKRIRRALRKKRRRKSSSTSKETTSAPSLPSFVRTSSYGSQVIDDLPILSSGHQTGANTGGRNFTTPEQERPQFTSESSGEVTTRDFMFDQDGTSAKQKKKHKSAIHYCAKEMHHCDSAEAVVEDPVIPRSTTAPALGGQKDGTASKRPFTLRNISYMPALPRVLTPNLFNSAQVQPEALVVAQLPGMNSNTNNNRLRRTSSLPDRLNKAVLGPTAATAAAVAIPSAQPLPHLVSKKRVEIKDDPEEKPKLNRLTAIIVLLVTTALVAVCAEFLVDSINYLVSTTGVSETFIGLIILPIVGNAAEHVTAVTVASKNKMDLAIGVALGSSIQIALFVTPVIVLLGWILNTEMSLYFSLFETVSLFASAFIVNYLMLDGRSNYLEGALLIAAYVIIAVGAYFYPSCASASALNGGTMTGRC